MSETLSAAEYQQLAAKPARRRRRQPELQLQIRSAAWLRHLEWIGPKPVTAHVPNERRSLTEALRMKNCGVRAGVADWLFWLPRGRTLAIELKVDAYPSPEQRAFRDELEALGHPWRLCRSIDEMAGAMREQGLEFRETAMAQALRRA